jgi:hypothetical protein
MISSKGAAVRVRSNELFNAWLLLTDRVLVEQAQAGTKIEWTVEPVFWVSQTRRGNELESRTGSGRPLRRKKRIRAE